MRISLELLEECWWAVGLLSETAGAEFNYDKIAKLKRAIQGKSPLLYSRFNFVLGEFRSTEDWADEDRQRFGKLMASLYECERGK